MNVYQGGEVVKHIIGAKPKSALLKDLEASSPDRTRLTKARALPERRAFRRGCRRGRSVTVRSLPSPTDAAGGPPADAERQQVVPPR